MLAAASLVSAAALFGYWLSRDAPADGKDDESQAHEEEELANKLFCKEDAVLLKGRPLHGSNKHHYWIRFGLSREEWMALIEQCIKFLRSNEGCGQIDLHSMVENELYKESVMIKCYQYIFRQ